MAFQIMILLSKNGGEKKMRNFRFFFFFEMKFFIPRGGSTGNRGVFLSRLGPSVDK